MMIRKSIEGLHCSECAAKVEEALRNVDGVHDVRIDAQRNIMEADIVNEDVFEEMCMVADCIEPGTLFV